MIKFSALNATEEVEVCNPKTNKEQYKSDAFQRYNRALTFIKNKENDKAEAALKELLLHPYFDFDEENFSGSDFFNTPAVKLLTSIYKNLGKVHEANTNDDEALECYLEAVNSDKSDITTWYNIANVYIKKVNYQLACESLKECLNIDPSFWPSIDTLICLLYALGDYLSCLHLIQHSLSLNSSFERALCVKEEIKKEDPFLFNNFRWNDGLVDLIPSSVSVVTKEMKYPLELRERDQQVSRNSSGSKADPILYLRNISKDNSLADFGDAIIELFCQVKKEDLSLFCPIDVSKSNLSDFLDAKVDETEDTPMKNYDEECSSGTKADTSDTLEQKQDKTKTQDDPDGESEKLAKELTKTVQRRSLRVRGQHDEGNESIKSLRTELENWLPARLKHDLDLSERKQSTKDDTVNKLHIDMIDCLKVFKDIIKDDSLSLIPLMKKYCNTLSRYYDKVWPISVKLCFLNVYLSYREYEVLPNILQNFNKDDTEDNAMTLLCAFEFIVNDNLLPNVPINESVFNKLKETITPGGLEKDQEFLRTTNNHEQIKSMFNDEATYSTFQVRFAWANGMYEEKLDKVDCAIEYVKLCLKKLEEESSLTSVIVANNSVQQINKETIEQRLQSLTDIHERDKVSTFFIEKNYSRVIEILSPILDEDTVLSKSSDDPVPNRYKDLLILLESLQYLKMHEQCLRCCNQLLIELTPCIQFSEVWKGVLTKIFVSLEQCLERIPYSNITELHRTIHFIMKIIVTFFDRMNVLDDSEGEILLVGFPIGRAFKIYHMIINKEIPENSESSTMETNINKIQCLIYCHDTLGRHKLCSVGDGVFLNYAICCCLDYKSKNIFIEDANNIFEQAVFCYICQSGGNSKRSKKNRIYHSASSVDLDFDIAEKLYKYYALDHVYLPFEKSKHLSADNYDLLNRIVEIFPEKISCCSQYASITKALNSGSIPTLKPFTSDLFEKFKDIFYMCADYLFKYENFDEAIKWYMSDLCLNPKNHSSWLGIALCWLSITEDHLNQAKSDLNEILKTTTPKVVLCFDHYFQLTSPCFEASLEYSSFLYTLASIYNQVASLLNDNLQSSELLKNIASKRLASLSKAKDLLLKAAEVPAPKCWIKTFMLGKIAEKLSPTSLEWLEYYMSCFDHLKDFTYSLTKKVNSGAPTEYSIECLEVTYRVAYSIFKRSLEHQQLSKDPKVKTALTKMLSMMNVGSVDTEIFMLILKILEECHNRFLEHYKVRNALCNLYVRCGNEECFKKASYLMLQISGSNGMFSFNRKHLFYGIWRIPVDAFDRPGGFFRHMRKSLSFLIVSLTHSRDEQNLMKLAENLMKTSDQISNFIGEVNQFTSASIKSFDAIIQNKISSYSNQKTTEKSIDFLRECMKAKSIHQKANVASRPIDESLLYLLWQFKLKDSQQLILLDKDALENPNKLYGIATTLINNYDQIQKMAKLLEIEKQRIQESKQKETQQAVNDSSSSKDESSKSSPEAHKPLIDQPSSSKNTGNSSTVKNKNIIVNENAKTVIRQAVASFITQIAEKNQATQSGEKNMSKFLNSILMKSFQEKNKGNTTERSTKIREALLKAAKKVNQGSDNAKEADTGENKTESEVLTQKDEENSSKAEVSPKKAPNSPKTTEVKKEEQGSSQSPEKTTSPSISSVVTPPPTTPVTRDVHLTPTLKLPKLQPKPSTTEKPPLSRSLSCPVKPKPESTDLINDLGSSNDKKDSTVDNKATLNKIPEVTADKKESKKTSDSTVKVEPVFNSDSDGSDDEMPQLDDVPSLESSSSKLSPPKHSSLLSQPPMLARKTSAYGSNVNIPNPPPIYCRSSSFPGPSDMQSSNLIHLNMKHGVPVDGSAMMESLQNMGLKTTIGKGRKSKTPRTKKDTVKKPRQKKEPKKPRNQKKRLDKEKRSLVQFDFAGDGDSNSENLNKLRHLPPSTNHQNSMFSPPPPSTNSKTLNSLLMQSYDNQIDHTGPSESLYKPDDFFASGAPNPNMESFLGVPTKENAADMYNQQVDSGLFSPNNCKNKASDAIPDEEDVDNVDLNILNELDGCDFNDDQQIVPVKGKRGRKSKVASKAKPAKRRKTKAKAQQVAEHQNMLSMSQVMDQQNKFAPMGSPYGMYQQGTPPMKPQVKFEPTNDPMSFAARENSMLMNNSDNSCHHGEIKTSPLPSPNSYSAPFTETTSAPLTHFPEQGASGPIVPPHRTASQFLPPHYNEPDLASFQNNQMKAEMSTMNDMSQRLMSPTHQYVSNPPYNTNYTNLPYSILPQHATSDQYGTMPESSAFLNSTTYPQNYGNF